MNLENFSKLIYDFFTPFYYIRYVSAIETMYVSYVIHMYVYSLFIYMRF